MKSNSNSIQRSNIKERSNIKTKSTIKYKGNLFSEISIRIIEEINKVRINPQYVLDFLNKKLEEYSKNNLLKSSYIAVQEAIEYIKLQKTLHPLIINEILNKTSKEHAEDIGLNNLFSHKGSDGKELDTRIERYSDWNGDLSENIDFEVKDCTDTLLNWIIDEGVESKIHRLNIFSENFKYIGAGVSKHQSKRIVMVVDFIQGLFIYNENIPCIVKQKISDMTNFKQIDNEAPENTIKLIKSIVSKTTFIPMKNDKDRWFSGNFKNTVTHKKIKKQFILKDGKQINVKSNI